VKTIATVLARHCILRWRPDPPRPRACLKGAVVGRRRRSLCRPPWRAGARPPAASTARHHTREQERPPRKQSPAAAAQQGDGCRPDGDVRWARSVREARVMKQSMGWREQSRVG